MLLGLFQEKTKSQPGRGWLLLFGAGEMNRTPDLLIANDAKALFACVD
jgi:hypothetical protein